MKILILAGALAAISTPGSASTTAAWASSVKAGKAACLKASDLARPTASGPIGFSDQIGRDAYLVRGMYKQRFMKGASGTMLCLYDRRTRRAEVSEAKGWSAR